jgi:hypothetical protein
MLERSPSAATGRTPHRHRTVGDPLAPISTGVISPAATAKPGDPVVAVAAL